MLYFAKHIAAALVAFAGITSIIVPATRAQQLRATANERAGAVIYGQHCSPCHGARLIKDAAAFDLTLYAEKVDAAHFVRGAKIARGTMPSFDGMLSDRELADIYAYVKRGHIPDLDDVPMESNH